MSKFSVCLEEEPLRQNWSPHARFMDKHQMTLKELSLQLESRSQENCLPQNLSEHDMRRYALVKENVIRKFHHKTVFLFLTAFICPHSILENCVLYSIQNYLPITNAIHT